MSETKDAVMQKIEKESIKMKPKVYFVIGLLALILGFTIAILTGIFFTSIFIFLVKTNKFYQFLLLGHLGARPFFLHFPWKVLIIGGISTAAGLYLIKKSNLAYKYKFSTVLTGLVAAIIVSGIILNRIGINRRMQNLPPMRGFYRQEVFKDDGHWVIGEISNINSENSFTIIDPQGETIEVLIEKDAKFPFGKDFDVGDTIRAVGNRQENTFHAVGVALAKEPMKLPMGEPPVKGMMHNRKLDERIPPPRMYYK